MREASIFSSHCGKEVRLVAANISPISQNVDVYSKCFKGHINPRIITIVKQA